MKPEICTYQCSRCGQHFEDFADYRDPQTAWCPFCDKKVYAEKKR